MSLLLTFPADANEIQAWVSVCQLLFTIASIVAVLVTLNLQAKTLQSQMDVQRMEAINNRIKLKPEVFIDATTSWIYRDDQDEREPPEILGITFNIAVKANQITNVKISIGNSTLGKVHFDQKQLEQMDRSKVYIQGELFHFYCNINWDVFSLPPEDERKYYFDFLLSYDDLLGTRYGQGIQFYPEAKNLPWSQRIIQPRKD